MSKYAFLHNRPSSRTISRPEPRRVPVSERKANHEPPRRTATETDGTEAQTNHTEIILGLLHDADGDWVSGEELTEESGTTNLSARLASLRKEGWVIDSRPNGAFHKYRCRGRGKAPGRRQLRLQLPTCPLSRGWTDEEADAMQEAAHDAMMAACKGLRIHIRIPNGV